MMQSIFSYIHAGAVSPSARWQRCAVSAIHACLIALAAVAAFLLRFEFRLDPKQMSLLGPALLIWLVAKTVIFHFFDLDRVAWRFASTHDVLRVGYANACAAVVCAAVIVFAIAPRFPRSILILEFLCCLIFTAGFRLAVRVIADQSARAKNAAGTRTLIYGAGAAGVLLMREARNNAAFDAEVCGFIDDDPEQFKLSVDNLPVLGAGADLPAVVAEHGISQVLIAIPSATGPQMADMIRHCQAAQVAFRTMKPLAELIEGRGSLAQIRPVAVEDLLGRKPVQLEDSRIREQLQAQVVIVTGAAGSIGSELCRQIARFKPAAIIGFECAETPLFFLEREMRVLFPDVPFHAEIGDIRNSARIAEVLGQYKPSILYHAAAYKHVPMMEASPFESVENNVFGTYNIATAAARYGVRDFVMISSDKAVRPTSVMGVTKRVAELVIDALPAGSTRYVSVRFGNVLGSNGSVVPIFKEQIASGGPVTITHPDMRRYFMTIPEASQLVLQASTMGRGNETFVLDMGDQVKIVDLARSLILLSGLRPDVDVKISFSGIRPGEKLYEELAHSEADTLPTRHPQIKVYAVDGVPEDGMEPHLATLRRMCAIRSHSGLILELKAIVPDYNPGSTVLKRCLAALHENGAGAPADLQPA
jgi:FlaA1/EpsC-like NDP-sugar epimerase